MSLCLAETWCETNEECLKNPPQEDIFGAAASEDEDEDENLNFPPLPALPPEAGEAAVESAEMAAAASSLLGMASPARDLIRDIEHKF